MAQHPDYPKWKELASKELRGKPVAGGAKIAFLHPKATNGVLVELCER